MSYRDYLEERSEHSHEVFFLHKAVHRQHYSFRLYSEAAGAAEGIRVKFYLSRYEVYWT